MAEQSPKYREIIDWVKRNIDDGTFRSGDRLPSEAEIGKRFGLSRQTVRHATGELERERLVTRIRGSGTYIGGAKAPRPARKRHMRVAVVSTFFESYIFPQTLKGIESVLASAGYTMQVAFTDNRISREEEILKMILDKDNIDGLIVEPAKSALPNPNIRYYREITELGIPMIYFNTFYPEPEAPCVRLDDQRIAGKAAELLIERGHREIAGIFKPDDGQGRLRYAGYLDALLRAGLSPDQRRVLWLDTTAYLKISDLEDYLFKRMEGCTGIVCYNDEIAYQVIELALRRNIRVPEDLSVVGIDDSYLAGVSRVPLTSFPHPKEMLGRKVGENLIRMIGDPDFDGNYIFDSEPVLRSSVAAPGNGIPEA